MYPIWGKTARDFALRLDKIGSGKAQYLAKRMKTYADEFDSWAQSYIPAKPDEKLRRSKIVGEYMTCYRDALDVFASQRT